MKKEHTIKKSSEFQTIMQTGSKIKTPFFIMYIVEPKEEIFRIGISVPKKLGPAVLRNKIKRQVKNILHDLAKEFPIKKDCIIILNRSFLELSFSEKKNAIYEQKNNLE